MGCKSSLTNGVGVPERNGVLTSRWEVSGGQGQGLVGRGDGDNVGQAQDAENRNKDDEHQGEAWYHSLGTIQSLIQVMTKFC